MVGDAIWAVVLLPWVTVSTLSLGGSRGPAYEAFLLLLGLIMVVPLLWRRTQPDVAALGVAIGHVGLLFVTPIVNAANILVPIVLYAVAAYGNRIRARIWLGVGLVAALAAGLRWSARDAPGTGTYAMSLTDRLTLTSVIGVTCAAIVLAAWFMGSFAAQRRLRVEELRERAVSAERERDQSARLAVTEERSRIAREMHDVVAHSLALIVVQCDGAVYVAGGDGSAEQRLATTSQALETIGSTARSALADTRRLVGVLKDEGSPAERAPQATLAEIPALVERLRGAGIPATFSVVGDPSLHAPLDSAGELATYRIVQESLTNVLKHAGPDATVAVQLAHRPGALEIDVCDTGQGTQPSDGLGHGLIGMRERAASVGGSLNARDRLDGGFEVQAIIPAPQEALR